MPFDSFVRDLKDMVDNLGSVSRRTHEVKISESRHIRSQSVSCTDTTYNSLEQGCWANLPPELLRDILSRVESAGDTWPARKDVVACSAVCKMWRKVMQLLVKTPEECRKLTFPLSLKQPGPRDGPLQCFIKRDRINSLYYLYLGLSPSLLVEDCKFLLVARKVRRVTSIEYVISLNTEDMSQEFIGYVGRLRSNFLGTKFTVYDSQLPPRGAAVSSIRGFKRIGSTKVSPKVPRGSYNVAHVAYELNVLGTRGPRRIQCTLHTIPSSCMEVGGVTPTQMELLNDISASLSLMSLPKPASNHSICDDMELLSKAGIKASPLILRNKAPRWHEQLQCWCLNFRGRVTVASVKNFQLVASLEASHAVPQGEQDKVLLQFGKIGKDIFTMDYRYPLSAFQAFAICLSSFDTKLACE